MMLTALVAYAEREGLGNLDFETRPVDYELRIDDKGTFVGLVPLGTDGGRARLLRLPKGPPSKNNPGYPNFVVDNARYFLGTPKTKEKAGNAKKCFDSYKALIVDAGGGGDEGLCALAKFLDRSDEITRADLKLKELEAAKVNRPETAAKNVDARADKVLAPTLDSDGALRVHERDRVVKWWTDRRAKERAAAAAGPLGRCLVTGALAPIARTHDSIKGPPFPGTGAKLLAFDKPAFTSQNLAKGDNAPVSEPAARMYTAALNALLERDPAMKRRRSAIDLDKKSVVVFWTREDSDAPGFVLDVFAPPARDDDAIRAAQSVWTGRASRTFDPMPFYGVTLGVNSARVVVRDWFETTAAKVKEALERWFADLHVGAGEPVPLGKLLHALEATPDAAKDKRGLPPGLAASLFRAAVQGGPLPRSLLAAAVERMRVPPGKKEQTADAELVLRARVAIIKAVLVRQRPTPLEVPVALDESNTRPPYLLGRLFAALERLQLDAAGKGHDPNATIRDRYAKASSTPAAVFGSLIDLSMRHASKARRDQQSLRAERAKEAIMSRFAAESFPRVLGLEDRGLFWIGYYHQRSDFFPPKQNEQKHDDPKGGTPS